MNALSAEELSARLDSIQTGPWMAGSAKARKKLNVADIQFVDVGSAGILDLDSLAKGQRASSLIKELRMTFKWHGKGRIPTHAERLVRDSFDDALTYLQMIELAIETGYLPAEQVADLVRPQFVSLLWAEPARQFVHIYDYTSVETLATRLHVRGFPNQTPPAVDPSGAVFFASFLATHRAIESDTAIDTWLAFLDDHVIREDEQNDFYDFLESGDAARSKRRLQLLFGARELAVMLADFLSTLPEQMQARFGGFYAYWLAKLFGFELRDGRYVRSEIWGRGTASWAVALKDWYRERANREKDAVLKNEADLVERSLTVLASTWNLVRDEASRRAKTHRAPATSAKKQS